MHVDCDIDDAAWTTRTRRRLKELGIKSFAELCQRTEDDLYRMPGLGRKSLNEIKECLFMRGLSLAAIHRPSWLPTENEERQATLAVLRAKLSQLDGRRIKIVEHIAKLENIGGSDGT